MEKNLPEELEELILAAVAQRKITMPAIIKSATDEDAHKAGAPLRAKEQAFISYCKGDESLIAAARSRYRELRQQGNNG